MDEKTFIVDSFNRNFAEYKKSNIVIYGLGKNTKTVLDECTDFNIVGLMDGTRTGEVQWGHKILSVEDLLEKKVEIIVIIATSANVPLIHKRIKEFCTLNAIQVYDINGELLGQKMGEYVFPKCFDKVNKSDLYKKIDSADVVSFDIFDTLLVRDVLHPTDVFELIERENGHILPEGYSFTLNRIRAEHELYMYTNPKIKEIYDYMQSNLDFPMELVDSFLKKEISKEKEVLYARKSMVDIVDYARKSGKIVCCTSDMYLPSDILKDILNDNGYGIIDNLIVSCEYGCSKSNGLFAVLRDKYIGKKILHIGDNYDADVRSAMIGGIDDIYELFSGYQMLQKSAFSFIEDKVNTLDEKIILGEFVANILNDPFLFEKTKGKSCIKDNYLLGYYFFEPMIHAFFSWMVAKAENDGIELLLLGSRDGWLIRDLLDIYQECNNSLSFNYKYFYASRSACTLAGLITKEDVKYAASLAFDGTVEEMLKIRFFLNEDEIQDRLTNENDEDYFDKHLECILIKSERYRSFYLEYIKRIFDNDSKIGFFDFVSSGTCQLWLEKIMDKQMTGYYFLRNFDEYKKHLNIYSLLKPKFVYEKQSKLYKDYVFLENVLTSPEPTVKYISYDGEVIFENEKRSNQTIVDLEEIHRGILDAFRCRQNYGSVSFELAEELVDIIRPEYSEMNINFFDDNALLDEFCNRKFELRQVLNTGE